MARPIVRVYLGATFNPDTNDLFDEPSSWADISADIKSANWQRGRQKDLDQIQAGSASLTLRNDHGDYTPTNTSSSRYPLGERQVKIEAVLPQFPGPLTSVLDTFNRANEGPPMTGWTAWLDSGLKVLSNQCAPNDSGLNNAYYSTAMDSPDVDAYVTLAAITADAGWQEVWARLDPAAVTGYCVGYIPNYSASQSYINLNRWVASSVTTLASIPIADLSAGDKIGIRCHGSTIEAWVYTSGIWTMVASETDTANDGTGTKNKLALNINGNGSTAARFDDFGGGLCIFPQFRGWIQRSKVRWSKDWPNYSEVDIDLTDLIGILQNWGSGADNPTAASVSSRLGTLLNSVGFPSGMRSLTGGSQTIGAPEGSVWEKIQKYVESDTSLNVCFVDGRGWAIFGPGTDAGVVFGDDPDTELWYTSTGMEMGVDLVYNHITVTREGGTPQVVTYQGNLTGPHGVRTKSLSTLNVSDADALTLAQAIYDKYNNPKPRLDPVEIEPGGNVDLWEQVLSLEPQDYFTIVRRPPGGGDFSHKAIVAGIATSVDFVGGGWKTTLKLAGQPIFYPSVDILDNFTRADTGPPPSSSWTTWWDSGLKVVSNQCAPNDTGGNNAYWNTAMAGPDVEAYVTVVTKPVTDGHTMVLARANSAGTNGYGAWHYVTSAAGTDDLLLIKFVSGVQSTIGGPWAVNFVNGDRFGIRCQGSTIELWVFLVAVGTWTKLGSVVDTSFSGASPQNLIGLSNYGNGGSGARYDNFGGGEMV